MKLSIAYTEDERKDALHIANLLRRMFPRLAGKELPPIEGKEHYHIYLRDNRKH